MIEPHAEPPGADVRSFLPRPGEPVDDYAARLRALHHDLSLVLDAVERGLAAAEATPEPARPALAPLPEPEREMVHDVFAEPRRSPPPPTPLAVPRGGARVEVVSTPATAHGGATEGEPAWSGLQTSEGSAPPVGRRATGQGVPAGGEPAPPPERSPYPEPWVERPAPPPRQAPWVEERREPWVAEAGREPWVEERREARPDVERRGWPPPPAPPAELSFAPPPHAPFAQPPRYRAPAVSPVLLAALILGWLTAIALVLAVAFGA